MSNNVIVVTDRETEFKSINTVKLVGSIVHKFRPRSNVITITLAVGQTGSERVEYPNVTFYGDNAAIIDDTMDVKPGQYPRVCINAMIQTMRRPTTDGTRYFQNIIGLEMRRAPTNMERLTGQMDIGSHKLQSCNEVCLLGEVVNIYEIERAGRDTPIGTIVTLKTVDNGKVNFPKVTCFGSVSRAASRLKSGDRACLTGHIQTKYKKGPGDEKGTRFESVIGSEVSKV